MSTGIHRYRFVSVPSGCEDYAVDDYIDLEVVEPPPAAYQLPGGPPCGGAELVLDDYDRAAKA